MALDKGLFHPVVGKKLEVNNVSLERLRSDRSQLDYDWWLLREKESSSYRLKSLKYDYILSAGFL